MKRIISFSSVLVAVLVVIFADTLRSQTWKELDSPVSVELKCGFFIDADHAVAVGEDGTLIYSLDAGENWAGLQDKELGWLWTADYMQGGAVVIAAGSNGLLMSSTDQGQTWTTVPTGLSEGSFIFGCQLVDDKTFYLSCGEPPSTAIIMKTTDGGESWHKDTVESMYFLEDIVFLNDQLGFTGGSTDTGAGKILKTTDGGITWTPIYETGFGYVTSVQCPSLERLYATVKSLDGNTALLARSTDGGASWAEDTVLGHDMFGSYFADTEHGYACGTQKILYTSNGGAEWIDAGYEGVQTLNSIQAFDGGAFAVGTGGTLLLYDPSASVESRSRPSVFAYPNPATSVVFIETNNDVLQKEVVVADALGRIVSRFSTFEPTIRIERRGLIDGIYHYFISKSNGDRIASGSFAFE